MELALQVKRKLFDALKFVSIFIALFIMLFLGNKFISNKIELYKEKQKEYDQLRGTVAGLQTAVQNSRDIIEDSDNKISENFMSKEEFISFIGSSCTNTTTKLVKLSGGNAVKESGISKINFCIEVEGELYNLYKLIGAIDELDTKYILNQISIRKTEEFLWLDRSTIGNSQLNWWDLSNIKGLAPSPVEPELVTIDKVLGTQILQMYLDISFVVGDPDAGV